MFQPALWAPDGFAAIPAAKLDPPHRVALPAVPALHGSGSTDLFYISAEWKVVSGKVQVLSISLPPAELARLQEQPVWSNLGTSSPVIW